ncbi:MAG: RDD family protein [Cyanobacteria bacterium J06648_16]
MNLFNKVTITTPESVELEFTLAGIGGRAFALFMDYIALMLLSSLLLLASTVLQAPITAVAEVLGGGTDDIELWIFAILMLANFALYGGYFLGFETVWQGQTPGKRLAKIRVIRDNGQPEGLFQATLRSLIRPVDDILFLGFFCILLGKQEKRIGDFLAGTLVVQTERPTGKGDIEVQAASKALFAEISEQANLENFLPDDFTVIREYLQRRSTLTKQARKDLSMKLAMQVKDVIELEQLPRENLPADEFLESIYWGYQEKFGQERRFHR